MLKLLATILVEAIVGVVIGGVLLAMAIPLLNHYRLATPGDLTSAAVVALVLVFAVGGVILRPGSAMNRYLRR